MKKSLLIAAMFVCLAATLLVLPFSASAQAPKTKTEVLKTDQCVRAIGWTEGCATFKANTPLETTIAGGLAVSGTLAQNACVKAQGWDVNATCAVFKAGTVIKFNDKGRVVTGTLAQDSNLRPAGQGNARTYKAGHTVTFDSTGHVIKETN